MEKLLSQLYVLRCIAQWRPHAHLAFLFHAPYRKMYDNQGQNVELCEEFYGQWVYAPRRNGFYEKVYIYMKHNKECLYHPIHAIIVNMAENRIVSVVGKSLLKWYVHGWCEEGKLVHITNMFRQDYETVKEPEDCKKLLTKMEFYRTKAITEFDSVPFY